MTPATGFGSHEFFAALGVCGAFLFVTLFGISVRSLIGRGSTIGIAIVFSLIASPITAVVGSVMAARDAKRRQTAGEPIGGFFSQGSDGVLSVLGILAGVVIVLGASVGSFAVARSSFDILGERLQDPVLGALLASGVVAGFAIALFSRRVGFLESLITTTVALLVCVIAPDQVADMFTYGTAPAYFAVLLLAGAMILFLSLIFGGAVGYMITGDGEWSFSWGYEWWVGSRYLMGKRNDNVIGLITVISVAAVAVGTMAMVVVMSVMNGFSTDLRSKIFGANAHLIVLKYGTDFDDYESVAKQTRTLSGVTGASPFVLNEVMISSDVNLTGAILKGIDVPTIHEVSVLRDNMKQGNLDHLQTPEKIEVSTPKEKKLKEKALLDKQKGTKKNEIPPKKDSPTPAPDTADPAMDAMALATAGTQADKATQKALPGIVIGQEMARSLKVFVGDPINVVSPVGDLGPTGPVPKARAFRVAGVFYSGMYEYDSKFAYIDLPESQDFFSLKGTVTGVEYKVDDIEDTQGISRDMLKTIGGYPYHTKDWMEMNRNLFSALKLEKIAMFAILNFIVLVASFLIAATLIVFVIEKGKEIAILKSMGASDTSIMKIFVTYGVIVGVVGTIFGVGIGLGICFAIKTFGIGLDPDVYYITHLPVHVDVKEVIAVAVAAILLSYFATIYPALLAARTKPVEGLRYD